ncbi:phage major capsid protein [Cereibacter azotoformans]|uniref:HK97 family phage prohead protease/HK97 family phage major capsid protein,TIGR01554 n=1 Tax=Cereibacter azotoformans TaxID=43057 RepID=A0A2T5JLK9_9RHOB|nr:phage major capsid protein [Cereibacter azotoformans]PTR07775.1 HK97 family phage prohead protease/HK97 family phage major capsid protein,TIGR01554 [Cereibacter azotoformans]
MDRIEIKAAFATDEAGTITGTAWPFGSPDRVGDVIEPGAFKSVALPLPMLASHDPADVVGVWESATADATGLQVKGKLLVEDVARAREVRALIQAKALTGLSIGFATKKAAPRRGGGRTISDLDLMEISVVAIPAHPGARITTAKAATAGKDDMTETNDAPDLSALETKMGQMAETLKGFDGLTQRLDKIEAKVNRPGTTEAKPEADVERKAFGAYLRAGNNAPAEELKTLTVSSDPQGGYLAPAEMSTEFLRDLVEFSPVRSVATIRGTAAPSVIYPTRTGITNAKWKGETQAQEASEPGFGQAEVMVKEINTYVDISNQLLADSAGQAEAEVRLALAEDFGQKEGLAFVSGDGVLAPEGFMNAAGISYTANGHATNLSADALVTMLYAIPATYRNRGAWAMNGTTLGVLRKLKDGQGNFLWQPSYQAGQPETILGRPVVEMVDMPDLESGSFPIAYADWSGYRIVDRLNLSVLVNPYIKATEGLTRIHATRRVGGRVLQPAKFRKLKMATS